ncbi:MAG: hypothetical protein ACREP4_15840 [Stenotrophomonas sp.]|uniref:hypothetical protein n=1 Tax=Stenotrophomonas sp. TaxID=69392 RepID=UPI003D6D8832
MPIGRCQNYWPDLLDAVECLGRQHIAAKPDMQQEESTGSAGFERQHDGSAHAFTDASRRAFAAAAVSKHQHVQAEVCIITLSLTLEFNDLHSHAANLLE